MDESGPSAARARARVAGARGAIPAGEVVGDTTVPYDAATVLLLRDGGDGLEVAMLERHLRSDFAGGAWVFPGGRVDAGDGDLPSGRWSGVDPASLVEPLGARDERHALAFLVATVRETFEEAGVLLAHREDGSRLTSRDVEAMAGVRRRLNDRDDDVDWHAWLADEGLVLDLGALALWSWWVTPDGLHKRFDTRFFVAAAPPEQVVAHDRLEVTDSVWTTPRAALAAEERGEVTIIYPTRKTLEQLSRYGSAQAAWQAAADGETDTRRLLPTIVADEDGELWIAHPDGGPLERG